MKKHIMSVVVAAALVLAGAATAQAQNTSASATAEITIPTVLFIDVTSDGLVSFDQPDATDFNNGFIPTSDQTTIDTKGNVVHDLTVVANSSEFTDSGGNATSKPASDLLWSASGDVTDASQGNPMPTSATDVATGLAKGDPSAIAVDYGLLLDYATDAPATYSLSFTYTVVAN